MKNSQNTTGHAQNPAGLESPGEPPWRFVTKYEMRTKVPEDAEFWNRHLGWFDSSHRGIACPSQHDLERTSYRTQQPLPSSLQSDIESANAL